MRSSTFIGLLGLVLPILATPLPNTSGVGIAVREAQNWPMTREDARVTITFNKPRPGLSSREEIHSLFPDTIVRNYIRNDDGTWTVPFPSKRAMDGAMAKVKKLPEELVKDVEFKTECEEVPSTGLMKRDLD